MPEPWPELRLGRDVGGRESEPAPPPGAACDDTFQLERTAEQLGRRRRLARRDQLADARRRAGHTVDRDRRDHGDLDADRAAERAEHLRVPGPAAAEAEVVADDDVARAELAPPAPGARSHGASMAANSRVNGWTIATSIPASAHQLQAAFQRHDQRWRALGREQAGGVGGEGQHRGLRAAPGGARARLGQQRGVPEWTPSKLPIATASGGVRRPPGRRAPKPAAPGTIFMVRRRDHAADSGDQLLQLERLFDDPPCVTPSAARRRGGTPVISASGASRKISASSAGSCAGPAEPATIRSLSTAAGFSPRRPVARRAHVAHQRGRKARPRAGPGPPGHRCGRRLR